MSFPNRRRFLQLSSAAVSGLALASCQARLAQRPVSSPNLQAGSDPKKLLIYTWADYSDTSIYDRFTEATGIQLNADTYDSNETMLAKIQAGGAQAYSVLYPTDYMVSQMRDLGLLTPLDKTKLQDLDNLALGWRDPAFDRNNAHSIPLSWGTTGLLYNKKKLNQSFKDWSDLWTYQDQLQGKMILMDDMRETLGGALKSLGYSYNTQEPTQIAAAAKKLKELKPAIASFQSFGWEDQILSGDLLLAMAYSGTGNNLMATNPDLEYVIPISGTSLWTDTMVIPKFAPNPEAAYRWINFLLDPKNVASMLEKLKFAPTNQAAVDLLPAALKNNEKMFPSNAIVDRCEAIAPVGEATALFEKAWNEIKSA